MVLFRFSERRFGWQTHKMLLARTTEAFKLIANSHSWKKSALAAATAAVFGLCGTQASAFSLGRIVVQSALGEPLRAEIEIPEASAEEAASLKAAVASVDAYRAAGVEYNALVSTVQFSLQRRSDGRPYLKLTTIRAVNEPFVDMILEANWSGGRIVRDYTMLFDPPGPRSVQSIAPVQIPSIPPRTGTNSAIIAANPDRASAENRLSNKATRTNVTPAHSASATANQLTVKVGDTASKIAASHKPGNASLDQMLVAMLKSSPDAFVDGNINRIKAGAIVNLPEPVDILSKPHSEAQQIIFAQSKNFNDYRRRLAGGTPTISQAAVDRKATGTIQTSVEERSSKTTLPDKLTLSKASIQGKASEEKIAAERAALLAKQREAELAKNINDLAKVAAGVPTTAAASVPSKVGTGASAPTSALAMPKGTIDSSPASLPASAPTPVVLAVATPSTPQIASSKAVASVPINPSPKADPTFIDELLQNPAIPVGSVALIALLAGFGAYRFKQRKKDSHVDSSYLESRLQPDSFFGASGGQQVDTNDGAATGSSMVYSPSQLDAADDVDPVAEADVYLAYGRDLQAEEILKEALRTNTQRIAIHHKLLEIYAKRKDAKSFESIANQAYKLTSGEGTDWTKICDLGLTFDPANPLYEPGGAPFGGSASKLAALDGTAIDTPASSAELPGASDLDLDLDFSLDEPITSTSSREFASNGAEPTVRMQAISATSNIDLDIAGFEALSPEAATNTVAPNSSSLEFELPDLPNIADNNGDLGSGVEDFEKQAAVSFGSTAPAPLSARPNQSVVTPQQDEGMLEFDLGSLSLDLGDSTEGTSNPVPSTSEDPLATKLALAEEFNAIGDADGARALIEEVVAEATGEMKAKAQRALNNL